MLRTVQTLVILTLIAAASGAQAATAKEVQAQATKAIATEAAAQREYQQWSDLKAADSSEIRDMKAMEAWLNFQNKKYAKYIQRQKKVIAELERRKEEAKRIRMELEPFLETVVDQLEQFVASDLPFLTEERQGRIAFLRESLDDYHLELSEKLRRIFEALLVETEYGRNVSATSQNLILAGRPTTVTLFRLGRTALFYQTADGTESGVWDKATESWKPLTDSTSRTLRRAKDMAERKRAVELLDLPVGAAR